MCETDEGRHLIQTQIRRLDFPFGCPGRLWRRAGNDEIQADSERAGELGNEALCRITACGCPGQNGDHPVGSLPRTLTYKLRAFRQEIS